MKYPQQKKKYVNNQHKPILMMGQMVPETSVTFNQLIKLMVRKHNFAHACEKFL
jgi:hypothetical protein